MKAKAFTSFGDATAYAVRWWETILTYCVVHMIVRLRSVPYDSRYEIGPCFVINIIQYFTAYIFKYIQIVY